MSTNEVTTEIISPATANVLGFLLIPIIDNINPVSHMIRFTIGSNTRNIATTDVMNPPDLWDCYLGCYRYIAYCE